MAHLSISSRPKGDENGWRIDVEGGRESHIKPTPMNFGTIVEVRDLFFAVPGRLKFMKTERAENTAILDVVRRMAHRAFRIFIFPPPSLMGVARPSLPVRAKGIRHC